MTNVVDRAWFAGQKPDPAMLVSDWADNHRILHPRSSSEAGRWKTSRTPYLREIMDQLSPSNPVQDVVFMSAAQVGKTESGNNFIGYVVHHSPGPTLAVQPTVELAKRFSQQRVDPLIESTPALSERIAPARSRDSGNTMLSKEFPGGILVMTGANSAVGLRSMPVRYLFLDEVDAYPASADDEGDPVSLAQKRTDTFSWRRKIFKTSTPTFKGRSKIEKEYEDTDQRRYFVPCPHCDEKQVLEFARLRWEKNKPETARYHCCECGVEIGEEHKTVMLERGEWRATAVSLNPLKVGFHLSGLYSPVGWLSWEQIARGWESCQSGNDEEKRTFINTVLGETWSEPGEAPEWERLYDRREGWASGSVPKEGLILTAGADVQKDRLEIDIWAWGRGMESWRVDHVVIYDRPDPDAKWADLDALLNRPFRHETNGDVYIARLAIDTGYDSPEVHTWARKQGWARVAPVKGVEGFNRSSPVAGPTIVDATAGGRKLKRGSRLWTVATSTFKSETYRYLRLERPTDEDLAEGLGFPAGTIHLPADTDSEWCKQLVSERLITIKTKRGFTKLEWEKAKERNEALDCRVYARAAAWIMGVDRFADDDWLALEHSDAVPPPSKTDSVAPKKPSRPRQDGWIPQTKDNWI